MHVEVSGAERLRFGDGSPVRAASAVVPFGDGHLVISDDAVHAAWFRRGGEPTRLRLLPPVDGEEVFDEESGTKHLKPDLEAACEVDRRRGAACGARHGLGLLAAADAVVPASARWTARRTSSYSGWPSCTPSCRPRSTSIRRAEPGGRLRRRAQPAVVPSRAALGGSSVRQRRPRPRRGCGPPHSARSDAADLRVTRPRPTTSGPWTAWAWRSPTSSRCRAATCSRARRPRTAPTPATTGR